MMEIKQTGIVDLKDVALRQNLYVFGAGRIMRRIMETYKAYGLEKCIAAIIDNNTELWGTNLNINGTEVKVCSVEEFANDNNPNKAIVIMVKDYEDILEQISSVPTLKNVEIYSYPTCRCIYEEQWKEEFSAQKLENRIVMYGEGDSRENALAIFDYLKETNLLGKYRIAWLTRNLVKDPYNENEEYIDRDILIHTPSLAELKRYYEVIYTSKFLFYENGLIYKVRDNQISAYLKHGTFPLKNVKGILLIAEDVDKVICTSENYEDLAEDMEGISKDRFLICGSPRLDFLYKEKHVLNTLGKSVKVNKKILWLPTLRQTIGRNDMCNMSPFGIPLFNKAEEFEKVDKVLGDLQTKLIIKPHPFQDLSVYKIEDYKNIIFITQQELDKHDFTVHSLMRETDALISDYSSIAFDYMLLDRPIAYTVDDMNEYKIGFSVPDPFHFMPGEKLKNVDDMILFFKHVINKVDVYKKERREIRDYIHKYQDDKNTERFLKMMGMI